MGDLSVNFDRDEFACKCGCKFDTVDSELLSILEKVRSHFGKPIIVTSACRCESHNKDIGGSANSYHLKGRASDIKIIGISPKKVEEFINLNYPKCGLGTYKTFNHIDSRGFKSRWKG